MITCPHCSQEFSEFHTVEPFPHAIEEVVMTILPRTKATVPDPMIPMKS